MTHRGGGKLDSIPLVGMGTAFRGGRTCLEPTSPTKREVLALGYLVLKSPRPTSLRAAYNVSLVVSTDGK